MAVSFKAVEDYYLGASGVTTKKYAVKAGSVGTIQEGDIVIEDGSNAGYAKIAADGASSTAVYLGVATSDSTDTASADGVVEVRTAPNLVIEGKVTTPGNLARATVGTSVTLDGTTGAQTIDENDTSSGVFIILDPLNFKVSNSFDTANGVHRFRIACTPQ